ncbi:MAG: hypothetical protein CSA35_05940 [Dethiosulfovibrio peptidovorans]|nr:MAG: hypothetical protein CSA35_05940 [Dethiosulfovibrio peptidovorans]
MTMDKSKIRWLLPAVLAVVILVVLITPRFMRPDDFLREVPSIRPVLTTVLMPSGAGGRRTFPGRVQASQKVDLSFRVSGPLVELPALEGEHVREGDLLARIDSRDFQLALDGVRGALSEARATLDAMRKGARREDLRALQAKVEAASSQAKEARSQFQRFKRLYEAQAISQAEFDRYRTARDVASSALLAVQEELKKARRGARPEEIRAMEAKISSLEAKEDAAVSALEDTDLLAPFDGIVARRMVDKYQFVMARQPVVSLQDASLAQIVVDVPESVIRYRSHQLRIWATFDSAPGRSYPLRLVEFASEPDPETQTYRVTLAMTSDPDFELLPGMTVQVVGEVQELSDDASVYTIPVEALLSGDGSPSVWLVVDGRADSRSVTVEALGDGFVQVRGDLKSGDRLITAGIHVLSQDQEVRLLEDQR